MYPSFREFGCTAFLYARLGGNKSYLELMAHTSDFVFRLRQGPGSVTIDEVCDYLVTFLNMWGCHLSQEKGPELILNALFDTCQDLSILEELSLASDWIGKADVLEHVVDRFKQERGIDTTIALKALHVINPGLFVPWDDPIWRHYIEIDHRIRDNDGSAYVRFLKVMRKMAISIANDFRQQGLGGSPERFLESKLEYPSGSMTMAKFLDEYNWIRFTKGIDPALLLRFCDEIA